MIVPIEDPSDRRIEAFRQVRERDLIGRDGLFIAEGTVVLEKAVAAGRHPIVSLLIAERRLPGLAPLLARLAPDVPVYVAAQPVLDAIAGFPMHRGVLGLGRHVGPPALELIAGLPEDALVVALVGVANHDNMGGVFRNAAAFGAAAVLLDDTCCDPLYRKAIRVSVGAALTTPFARAGSAAEMAALLSAQGFSLLALTPSGETDLAQLAPGVRRTAALIGSEGHGLPADLLKAAISVRITMSGGFDSLNLATTSGILLHHLRCRNSTI